MNLALQTKTRRSFLYGATAAMGAAGVVATAWPLVDHMNPDAGTRAAGDFVNVYLDDLRPGQPRVEQWRYIPVLVVKRTAEMLAAMQDQKFVSELIDPHSQKRQQPDYAKNWHRSINPAYAVLANVCTHCRCRLSYQSDDTFGSGRVGGYGCPCCASYFDAAGRVYRGIAQHNLAVPPHDLVDQTRILIGKNPAGSVFSFDSIERA